MEREPESTLPRLAPLHSADNCAPMKEPQGSQKQVLSTALPFVQSDQRSLSTVGLNDFEALGYTLTNRGES